MNKQTIDQILHDIFIVGINAASIFIKNPDSRAHASSIIQLLNTTVLPIADSLLGASNPQPASDKPAA